MSTEATTESFTGAHGIPIRPLYPPEHLHLRQEIEALMHGLGYQGFAENTRPTTDGHTLIEVEAWTPLPDGEVA